MENLEISVPETKSEVRQCEPLPKPAWMTGLPEFAILIAAVTLVYLFAVKRRDEPDNVSPNELIKQKTISNHHGLKALRKDFEDYKSSTSKISNAQVMDTMVLLNRQQESLEKDFKELKFHLQDNHLKLSKETIRRINKIEYKFLKHMEGNLEKKAVRQGQDKEKTAGSGQRAEGRQVSISREEKETRGLRETETAQREGKGIYAFINRKGESPL